MVGLAFFGTLARPGKDLGQDFLDMAYIVLYFSYYLSPYYQFVILNLLLRYVLLLYYMLVLLPLSGASYYTVYLFISLIYTIVKFIVLLLLCITTTSIACATYFIRCVILFDL